MARPRKEGMDYFSFDVDFFTGSKKIKILKARYGADGIVIYLYLLCEIYKNGYYLKVDDDFEFVISDDLNMNCDKVKQVLNFLLERSLFDNKLFQSDKVLTSAGIQKRFQLAVKTRASKNPVTVKDFWVLSEEETETFIKVNPSLNNSVNNNDYSEKNELDSENNSIKESKVNKSICIDTAPPDKSFSPELEKAFQLFLVCRKQNGQDLNQEQIRLLREELCNLSDKDTERIAIVKNHIEYMENIFNDEAIAKLYVNGERIRLWEDTYEEQPLVMELWFHGGQRKEGCLSLVLSLGADELYQIMFWLAPSPEDNEMSLWIGALQGTPNGSEIIKGLTKAFFGYRTKNLIFYGIRNVAAGLGCKHLYAVSNAGYYAMNHVRIDRKLKTSLDDFWQECEGQACKDQRFFEMPIEEYRKSMEELKPSKRAQHRRRFAKMDEITESVTEVLNNYKK